MPDMIPCDTILILFHDFPHPHIVFSTFTKKELILFVSFVSFE